MSIGRVAAASVAERVVEMPSGDRAPGSEAADALLLVGKVGRAHGLRGEVAVLSFTDDPDLRFAAGAVLSARVPSTPATNTAPSVVTGARVFPALTVVSSRHANGRLLVQFAEVTDRNASEALRGTELYTAAGERPALSDPDDFYDSDLVGLRAITVAGELIGEVAEVIHAPGGDLLAVAAASGEVLIPFVRQIVPQVDVAGGTVTVDPPEGLLEL